MEGHAGNLTTIRMKGDEIVNSTVNSQIVRENQWKKKSSTVIECENIFVTLVEQDKIMLPTKDNTWEVN